MSMTAAGMGEAAAAGLPPRVLRHAHATCSTQRSPRGAVPEAQPKKCAGRGRLSSARGASPVGRWGAADELGRAAVEAMMPGGGGGAAADEPEAGRMR